MDDIDEIRETLFQAMDNQLATDREANAEAYKLGQQKIMYNNDARGTLYSGQPTWERAQLASSNTQNLADIENKYLKQKISVWDNITNTLDQINSYNKAAAAMNKAASNASSSSSDQSLLQIWQEWYKSMQKKEGDS